MADSKRYLDKHAPYAGLHVQDYFMNEVWVLLRKQQRQQRGRWMQCKVAISHHNTHAMFTRTPAARKNSAVMKSRFHLESSDNPTWSRWGSPRCRGFPPATQHPLVPEMQRKAGLPKPLATIALAVSIRVGGPEQFWSNSPGHPSHCKLPWFTGRLCSAQTIFLSEKTKWEIQIQGCTKCPPIF